MDSMKIKKSVHFNTADFLAGERGVVIDKHDIIKAENDSISSDGDEVDHAELTKLGDLTFTDVSEGCASTKLIAEEVVKPIPLSDSSLSIPTQDENSELDISTPMELEDVKCEEEKILFDVTPGSPPTESSPDFLVNPLELTDKPDSGSKSPSVVMSSDPLPVEPVISFEPEPVVTVMSSDRDKLDEHMTRTEADSAPPASANAKPKPGKLKSNLMINVQALVPGRRFTREVVDEPDQSEQPKVPASDPPTGGSSPPLLDNDVIKSRVRVKSVRRPQTKQARRENLRKYYSEDDDFVTQPTSRSVFYVESEVSKQDEVEVVQRSAGEASGHTLRRDDECELRSNRSSIAWLHERLSQFMSSMLITVFGGKKEDAFAEDASEADSAESAGQLCTSVPLDEKEEEPELPTTPPVSSIKKVGLGIDLSALQKAKGSLKKTKTETT